MLDAVRFETRRVFMPDVARNPRQVSMLDVEIFDKLDEVAQWVRRSDAPYVPLLPPPRRDTAIDTDRGVS